MASTLTPDELQAHVAVSLARVTAAANRRARELGVDIEQCLLTITQFAVNGGLMWKFNCGAKNYIGRRGGDLFLEVDPADATVKRELRGQ